MRPTRTLALNDSADYDVVEAGKLPGLSCAGQFEIATAFYKAAEAAGFVNDAPVTYDGETGNIRLWVEADGTAGVPIFNASARLFVFVERVVRVPFESRKQAIQKGLFGCLRRLAIR